MKEEMDFHNADEAGFIYCTLMNHRIKRIKYDPRRVDHRVFHYHNFQTRCATCRESLIGNLRCAGNFSVRHASRGMSDGGPGPRGAAPAETSAQSGDSPDAAPVAQPPKLIKSVWKPEVRPRDSRTAEP